MRLMRAGMLLACVVTCLAVSGPAMAESGSAEPAPRVKGEIIRRGARGYVSPRVAAGSAELPLTGADVALLAVAGGAALGAGTILVRRTRERADP
jgi:LPXTG-motif cell wall-anchored protein